MTNLYSVTYNTNNSTGGVTPPTQSASSDSTTYTFKVPTAEEYGLARAGYTFMGWAENPNTPSQQYNEGSTIELTSVNSNKTLYAIWGKEYTVNFSLGDAGTGSIAPAAEKVLVANFPYTYTPKVTATTGSQSLIYKAGYAPNGWNDVTFTNDNPNPTTTPLWTTNITSENITTMQGMSNTICSSISESSKQLFDTRDGKKYWVARLKDGNCWMTQNLDYDDPGGTKRTGDTKPYSWPNENDTRQYWDPGEKIVNGNTLVAATSSTDRHLLVGNYYSWLSATNGTGASITAQNDNASGSICPEGWSLPLSGTKNNNNSISNNAASGSFGKMLSYYGVITGSDANLIKSPLYFLRGGVVFSGSLNNAGSNGYYWSSTANSGTGAYLLYFDSSTVNPSYSSTRYNGMSVRCIVE